MPRQRIDHSGIVYVMPDDFPERLKRLKEESGITWAEFARRIGASPDGEHRAHISERLRDRHCAETAD